MIISNNKYFIDQINSSKANKMTALYHYSGVGFKKARINLGIFRKDTKLMVGVLQFGCSFQEKIRLDRYVKENISKEEYLELNRFSMADSEGPNSESQAISLGIKWIKKNMPEIRLLVSYAGRKEGNYGYIYQATNWEYLGYFVSPGFWFVDGEERHLNTLWSRYKKHGNPDLNFIDALCEMYSDVRQTWTKQFIYIQRLDKKLTPASPILDYPKPSNNFPIKVKEKIYKQNVEVFESYSPHKNEEVKYYYVKDEQLFSNAALIRQGKKEKTELMKVVVYDSSGDLEKTFKNVALAAQEYQVKENGIRQAIREEKIYKNKYYRKFIDINEVEDKIEVPIICFIDEIAFCSFAEAGRYLGVSRQAVYSARQRKAKIIKQKEITWIDSI